MGTSPNPGVSGARCTMRAFVIVLLASVAVNADAEAEAYTVGQVAAGLTNGGIVTGVDHGHGVVSGYGAIGNRAISHVAGVYNAHPVNTVYNTVPVHNVAGVYNTAVPTVHAGVYNTHHAIATPVVRRVGVSSVYPNFYSGLNHVYGKREAEAEPYVYSNLYNHAGVSHIGYNYPAVTGVHGAYNYPTFAGVHNGVFWG